MTVIPSPRRRLGALGALTVLAGSVLAGCGGGASSNGESKLGARQIITDAEKATAAAKSVRVSGKGQVNGQAVQLDLVDGQGAGGGTVTIGGSTVQLVLAGSAFYLKTTPAVISSLTGNPATAQADANKWLQTTSTNASVAQLVPLLDITKVSSSFMFSGIPNKGSTTKINGQSAIPITDPSSGETLYVAATGKPYILAVKGSSNSGGSTITYTDYNSAPVPPAPTGATKLPSS